MRRGIGIGLVALALGGCGSGGLKGTLVWTSGPAMHGRSASGVVQNTTAHAFDVDPHALRLLDADGRKVEGRFSVARSHLRAHATTSLAVRWRTGKPVRIDYGAGALRLTPG